MTEEKQDDTDWKVAHAELRQELAEFRCEIRNPIHQIDCRLCETEAEVKIHQHVLLVLLAGMGALCWRGFGG